MTLVHLGIDRLGITAQTPLASGLERAFARFNLEVIVR
jgi:hypothetical protein